MINRNYFKLVVSTFAAAMVLVASESAFAQHDATQIERGRVAYTDNGCYRCHGFAGQGALGTAPALAGLTLPYEAIDAYIRAPSGEMPPYSKKILSEGDLRDITAFIGTLKVPGQAQ